MDVTTFDAASGTSLAKMMMMNSTRVLNMQLDTNMYYQRDLHDVVAKSLKVEVDAHLELLPDYVEVEKGTEHIVRTPRWLDAFLEKTFFDGCEVHPVRRNELNKYCINCNQPACQFCLSPGTHRNHKILKIYRHVYKDVVSLGSIEKHIDCSLIQPYKCNKRLVIALNPLPHSGSTTNAEASCDICQRRLTEPDLYRYCSISCKVTAVLRKPRHSDPPFICIQGTTPETKTSVSSRLCNKRKGTPSRAPFF